MSPVDLVWVLLVVLGVRLLHIARSERSSPEAFLGIAVLAMGPGAGLLRYALERTAPEIGLAGATLLSIGTLAMVPFTYTVFRLGDRRAQLFGLCAAMLVLAGLWHQYRSAGLDGRAPHPSPVYIASRLLVYGWAALEATRYRRMYVRRRALGLADPVIANRFLLYALWTGALALMPLVQLVGMALGAHADAHWRAFVARPIRGLGLLALASLVLTFVPPRAYVRWLERRHRVPGADAHEGSP